MRCYLNCLLFAVFVILIAGCNRSADQPEPPVANIVETTAESRVAAPLSALATPTAIIQQSALSPLSLPAVTSAPMVVIEPTSLPYPQRYTADGTHIQVTPVPSTPIVTCTPQDEVFACYDELLDMTFSYPAFMGRILYTQLRKGGYSGYAYEYAFEDEDNHGDNDGGGRSGDFSEGRGPMYTDQAGFAGQPAEDICAGIGAGWVASICQELSPSAVLIVMLPQAEGLCSNPYVP